MLNKVGFCCNISFWPYLIYFWAVSLQNRLKMCAFFEGYHVENQLWAQPVQTGLVALFESMQPQPPVQSSFRSFFSPMDQTFKHYLLCKKKMAYTRVEPLTSWFSNTQHYTIIAYGLW